MIKTTLGFEFRVRMGLTRLPADPWVRLTSVDAVEPAAASLRKSRRFILAFPMVESPFGLNPKPLDEDIESRRSEV
jgi:hypothetical protein